MVTFNLLNPTLGRHRQVHLYELEVSLIYTEFQASMRILEKKL